jgi:hypothetical protein
MVLHDHPTPPDTGVQQDWLAALNQDDIKYVVLHLGDDGDVVQLLRSLPGWLIDFEDDEAVIFARAA